MYNKAKQNKIKQSKTKHSKKNTVKKTKQKNKTMLQIYVFFVHLEVISMTDSSLLPKKRVE